MTQLSITQRLTLTTAFLTALVFLPAGWLLYSTVADGIENENVRTAESHAKNLAFMTLYNWDEDLLVEYKPGGDPLSGMKIDLPDWALVRGNGAVLHAHGLFRDLETSNPGAGSFLLRDEEKRVRVVAVHFVEPRGEKFEDLPPGVQETAREVSPHGIFFRAKREVERKAGQVMELAFLEPDRVCEVEMTYDGFLMERDIEPFEQLVPGDLLASIEIDHQIDISGFKSWAVSDGQLIATVAGASKNGEPFEVSVNRLGERFFMNEETNQVIGHDPDWRLWLLTASDATGEVAEKTRLGFVIAIALPLVWLAVVLVGWYVTRRALAPVREIVDTVERIELSQLGERLTVGGIHDELASISTTINRMLDRIESGYKRERQFTGDASHELRGPLAKVIADIDVALSRSRDEDEYRAGLGRCRGYAVSMQRLVESLLMLSRLDSREDRLKSTPFEVTDLLADTVSSFSQADARRIHLELDTEAPHLNAIGDPSLISVLVHNLVENALRYSPGETPVAIKAIRENGRIRIEVVDIGPGIPDSQADKVFLRFYRVDKSRARESGPGGFGLGLSIVKEIAEAHGIRVTLKKAFAGGTEAGFDLPAAT